jgi:hypothetical protein
MLVLLSHSAITQLPRTNRNIVICRYVEHSRVVEGFYLTYLVLIAITYKIRPVVLIVILKL